MPNFRIVQTGLMKEIPRNKTQHAGMQASEHYELSDVWLLWTLERTVYSLKSPYDFKTRVRITYKR